MTTIEPNVERQWFCVQTHPKHEHIAARGLVTSGGFEVFNPRMRIRRPTMRGPIWMKEPAFPGYLFVRFNLQIELDKVRYANSVSRVVHFHSGYPIVSEKQITDLREVFGDQQIVTMGMNIAPGDKVRVVGGAFDNLVAVVTEVRPAKDRVVALLELLGSMTTIELGAHSLIVEGRPGLSNHPLIQKREIP